MLCPGEKKSKDIKVLVSPARRKSEIGQMSIFFSLQLATRIRTTHTAASRLCRQLAEVQNPAPAS